MKANTEQNVLKNIAVGPGLTKEQAKAIYHLGEEAVIFALLQQAQMLAKHNNLQLAIGSDPSTPSAQKPVFVRPNKNDKKRSKKPGCKKGHKGFRRQQPERIDRTVEHRADCCPDCGSDWPRFCKKLKRLIRDAIRLRKRNDEPDEQTYNRCCERIEKRLQLILAYKWSNSEARRLIKRLRRYHDELFTFLYNEDVPFDNNFGDRGIRGAVIMRKNSYNNRSRRGAMTQSVLMSVFFTLRQRGMNPVDTVQKALKIYIKTGNLPRLAEFATSNG